VLLEKAPELGGTAAKAAFWYWVPNNEPMRAAGLADPEDGFLRYVARLSRPTRYDPDGPTLGVSEHEHAMYKAIYESAFPAAELLNARGALPYRHVPEACDYFSEIPEDAAPRGRVLIHLDAAESMSDGAAQHREHGVVNEKLQYNELAQEFFRWDPQAAEYPNLVMVARWDQRTQDHSAGTEFGVLVPPPGADDSHVVHGSTLAELTGQLRQRPLQPAGRR